MKIAFYILSGVFVVLGILPGIISLFHPNPTKRQKNIYTISTILIGLIFGILGYKVAVPSECHPCIIELEKSIDNITNRIESDSVDLYINKTIKNDSIEQKKLDFYSNSNYLRAVFIPELNELKLKCSGDSIEIKCKQLKSEINRLTKF